MKKRIVLFVILIIIFSCCFINKSYAATSCTLEATLSSSSAKPGEEVQLNISITKIKKGIAGVGFALDFDSSILEITGVKKVSGWTITQTENTFTVITDNYESTKKTGNIGIIKLKVKKKAEDTKTTIKLKSVQVTKDDATIEKLSSMSKKLTIKSKTSEKSKNDTEDTASKKTNTKTSTDTSSKKVTKLPYTGNNSIGLVVLFITVLIAVVSFTKYKKYKKI